MANGRIRRQMTEDGRRLLVFLQKGTKDRNGSGTDKFNRRGHRDRRVERTENVTADDSDFTDERREFFTKGNEGNEDRNGSGSENFNRRGHRDRRVEKTDNMSVGD
jgi:hypothetical protein